MNENLAKKIESRLPAGALEFISRAAGLATVRGEKLYLVGGVVRDLLLGRQTLDIDLVVEGDAAGLARELAGQDAGVKLYPQFNTARLVRRGLTFDLATARKETYPRPGALPLVSKGDINEDLFRRDFTINAMAVALGAEDYGRLIDPYNGQRDLGVGLIRIIHPKSFLDDSTRIWRGLRYEQRLDFCLEPETLQLLKRDIQALDTVSGDRIFYELECIFKEEAPERILRRAAELGVLQKISPALAGDGLLAERFIRARGICRPDKPSAGLYLALLAYDLDKERKEKIAAYFHLNRQMARALVEAGEIKDKLPRLSQPGLKPSAVYHLLNGYSATAVTAVLAATDSACAGDNIRLYLDKLSKARTILSGDDLIRMGIPKGPRIKEALGKLLDARLDGAVKTREDEERAVRSLT